MAPDATPVTAAIGFRVKSGWATAVILGGGSSPTLLECGTVLLSDPAVPESKQPYHAALELPEKEGKTVVERLRKVVERAAARSVTELLQQSKDAGRAVRAAGLVVGSMVDPASLHNDHIRAHALEGQLCARNPQGAQRVFQRGAEELALERVGADVIVVQRSGIHHAAHDQPRGANGTPRVL